MRQPLVEINNVARRHAVAPRNAHDVVILLRHVEAHVRVGEVVELDTVDRELHSRIRRAQAPRRVVDALDNLRPGVLSCSVTHWPGVR